MQQLIQFPFLGTSLLSFVICAAASTFRNNTLSIKQFTTKLRTFLYPRQINHSQISVYFHHIRMNKIRRIGFSFKQIKNIINENILQTVRFIVPFPKFFLFFHHTGFHVRHSAKIAHRKRRIRITDIKISDITSIFPKILVQET